MLEHIYTVDNYPELNQFENTILSARLTNGFDGYNGYDMEGKTLQIRFRRMLKNDEVLELHRAVKLWDKDIDGYELNFDADSMKEFNRLMDILKAKFGAENIEYRKSAKHSGHFHIRIIGRKFTLQEIAEYHSLYENETRSKFSQLCFQYNVNPSFLYNMKKGWKAGEWVKCQ
jgi:hypothetical protein